MVVARPSRWGNPFSTAAAAEDHPGADEDELRARTVSAFRDLVEGRRPDVAYPSRDEVRAALAGRDLACWCPLDGPCHADVLLGVANGPDGPAPGAAG